METGKTQRKELIKEMQKKAEMKKLEGIIMRCDSDSGKKLIKSMVLRTADRQGMC